MANRIDRSTVNTEQYTAPEFQKSGFDLSYSRHTSAMFGRIHIGGFQYVMPGDRISGSTTFNGTFNRIVTPMVTPVRAMSYNIYLPFRAVDTSFVKGMTPTKLNNMSSSWSVPTFKLKVLVQHLFSLLGLDLAEGVTSLAQTAFEALLSDIGGGYEDGVTLASVVNSVSTYLEIEGLTLSSMLYSDSDVDGNGLGLIAQIIHSLTEGDLHDAAAKFFLDDVLQDIVLSINAKLGTFDNPISSSTDPRDFMYNLFDCILSPFVGRFSYLAEFKYNYLRPSDFYRICFSTDEAPMVTFTDLDSFYNVLDDTPLCEYPIRIMYAIWYELFRNVDLEPVGGDLPDWREFGINSITHLFPGSVCYFLYRPRNWEKDMFISAQVDDISRHVYAPIVDSQRESAYKHASDYNNLDVNTNDSDGVITGSSGLSSLVSLKYLDPLSGESKQIDCPVPSNVNDVLSYFDSDAVSVFGLDLNTLRQSQMLERYLKRNYLFGDEYQDRLLAHYNSRLSDLRINRPEIIGRAINDYSMGQEVSNVSTDQSHVGDRTATAEISVSGDGYTTYCEEFGMIINILSIMPRPMYDGVAPQLLIYKQSDFPLPEFAANNEEFGRKMEIASSGLIPTLSGDDASDSRFMFGRYPAYHAWRSRVDEVGGLFLNELQDCTFRRFWGLYSAATTPKLNYQFLHCRPNLNMFADNLPYSQQVYGDFVHECYVERVLPTPVEVI